MYRRHADLRLGGHQHLYLGPGNVEQEPHEQQPDPASGGKADQEAGQHNVGEAQQMVPRQRGVRAEGEHPAVADGHRRHGRGHEGQAHHQIRADDAPLMGGAFASRCSSPQMSAVM